MRTCEISTGLNSPLLVNNYGKLKPGIVWLDEVYSHIVKSHSLRENTANRGIISFTPSYELAMKVMKDFPGEYEGIYYIDLAIYGPTIIDNPHVLFAIPVYQLENWIELAAKAGRFYIHNLNYNTPPVPLINAIAYNSSSALSYANAYEEYALVCSNLRLNKVVDFNFNSHTQIPKDVNFKLENKAMKPISVINTLLASSYFEQNSNRVISLKKSLEKIRVSEICNA